MRYRGFDLDPFQIQAIEALKDGDSVLVSAPTGTGKTIIADWIVQQSIDDGGEVVYTAPIKALSNQKFRDYTRLYGEDRVGLVTGDLVIRRDAPCRVMTTEVLRNMLLSGEELPNLRAVVLDEIHFLDDPERGTVWEEVLIYLPKHVQIVGLSATLSNLDDFAEWLAFVRDRTVTTVTEDERAVPLKLHYASVDTGLCDPKEYEKRWKRKAAKVLGLDDSSGRGRNSGRGRGGRNKKGGRNQRGGRGRAKRRTSHIDLFRMAEEAEMLPFLYFVFSRRDTEVCARRLGDAVDSLLSAEDSAKVGAILDDVADELGSALDDELRALYMKGIGFHHAGLHVRLKTLVEELYEERLIQALYCTSTFALGINLPARSVIFDGLKKYDGRGFNPLTTRQFMQKAGRAGRRGLDDVGHVIVRVDLGDWEEVKPHLTRYHENRVEPVRSGFNLSWNSIVNLLAQYDDERCRQIVEKSFLNWWREAKASTPLKKGASKYERRTQRRATQQRGKCWAEFQSKVRYLERIGYLDENGDFNAGAKVLTHLQIDEILVTELVLEGIFHDLPDDLLFGLCCSLTNNLPRRVTTTFRPKPDEKALAKAAGKVRLSPIVGDAEEMTTETYTFDRELIPVGRAWANGQTLEEINEKLESETDISGGLITGFRRAKDLVSQLADVYAEDTFFFERLRALARRVSRDEVEVIG